MDKTKRIVIDTNLLIRYLINDDARKAQIVDDFLRKAAKALTGQAFTSPPSHVKRNISIGTIRNPSFISSVFFDTIIPFRKPCFFISPKSEKLTLF